MRTRSLPSDLIEDARAFTPCPPTQEAYRRCWLGFEAWCRRNARQALPAAPETVAAWMTALATGNGFPQPLARSSINLALSAVIIAHRTAGHALDRKHPMINGVWRGISNTKAKTEMARKAQPLMADELRKLLEGLRLDVASDARNAALIALGWAGALRRSELVGLDWQHLGSGCGFVLVTELGVEISTPGTMVPPLACVAALPSDAENGVVELLGRGDVTGAD